MHWQLYEKQAAFKVPRLKKALRGLRRACYNLRVGVIQGVGDEQELGSNDIHGQHLPRKEWQRCKQSNYAF